MRCRGPLGRSPVPPRRPTQRPLTLDAGTIRLGCAPIINLVPRTTEPIRLDHTRLEYRLVPDSRWKSSTEIYTIVRVSRSSVFEDDTRTIRPSFPSPMPTRWIRTRPSAGPATTDFEPALTGTEMCLSFVDPELNPANPAGDVVFAHTLCTNRNLAGQMPAGNLLQLELDAPLQDIVCLTKPTAQIDPPLGARRSGGSSRIFRSTCSRCKAAAKAWPRCGKSSASIAGLKRRRRSAGCRACGPLDTPDRAPDR